MMVLLCSLDALHNCAGIIHGDLKPDNVVRCATSMLKLIDFGCAAEIDPRGQQQVGPEGSMAFMAPEKMFEGRDGTAADM
jgi:serine/threonine protein kinase